MLLCLDPGISQLLRTPLRASQCRPKEAPASKSSLRSRDVTASGRGPQLGRSRLPDVGEGAVRRRWPLRSWCLSRACWLGICGGEARGVRMSGLPSVPEPGRPEQCSPASPRAGFVLGLDVGSSMIRCHVYDHAGRIRGSSAQKVTGDRCRGRESGSHIAPGAGRGRQMGGFVSSGVDAATSSTCGLSVLSAPSLAIFSHSLPEQG